MDKQINGSNFIASFWNTFNHSFFKLFVLELVQEVNGLNEEKEQDSAIIYSEAQKKKLVIHFIKKSLRDLFNGWFL